VENPQSLHSTRTACVWLARAAGLKSKQGSRESHKDDSDTKMEWRNASKADKKCCRQGQNENLTAFKYKIMLKPRKQHAGQDGPISWTLLRNEVTNECRSHHK
jgi:hypothetical protein